MDRGAWWATVQGVEKSQTRPSDCHSLTDSPLLWHLALNWLICAGSLFLYV